MADCLRLGSGSVGHCLLCHFTSTSQWVSETDVSCSGFTGINPGRPESRRRRGGSARPSVPAPAGRPRRKDRRDRQPLPEVTTMSSRRWGLTSPAKHWCTPLIAVSENSCAKQSDKSRVSAARKWQLEAPAEQPTDWHTAAETELGPQRLESQWCFFALPGQEGQPQYDENPIKVPLTVSDKLWCRRHKPQLTFRRIKRPEPKW